MSHQEEWIVSLKDGTKIDARAAMAVHSILSGLAKRNPQLVVELRDFVDGNTIEFSDLARKTFSIDAPLGADYVSVMKNAGVRRIGKQWIVGDPFIHTDESEHIFRTIVENIPLNLQKLFGYDDENDRSR